MTDQNQESDDEANDEDTDATQYGGGTEDIDAVEQTERREDEVESTGEDDEEPDESE